MGKVGVIVFLVVGIGIAWLTRNSGMSGGGTFLAAFVPALAAGWIAEKIAGRGKSAAAPPGGAAP